MENNDNIENKRARNPKRIGSWVCGIFFIICGLGALSSGAILSGVLILLGGVILLPVLRNYLMQQFHLKPMMVTVIAIVFILVGFLVYDSGNSVDEGSENTDSIESSVDESSEKVNSEDMESHISEDGNLDNSTVFDEDDTENAESHIYDNAEIIDVMNGSRTEKIGEMSLIRESSSNVTETALTDWYYNYVLENDFNYCLILYTDIENKGCYSINGIVEVNVGLEDDGYGLYMLSDSSESILYLPAGDGILVLYGDEEDE